MLVHCEQVKYEPNSWHLPLENQCIFTVHEIQYISLYHWQTLHELSFPLHKDQFYFTVTDIQ